jgi:tetratricopeptide (TPR) repeat protein
MRRLSLQGSLLLILSATILQAQVYSAEQVEVAPPAPRVDAPSSTATVAELEKRGDELRAVKDYLDAIDYFQSALNKDPHNAVVANKLGLSYLAIQRYVQAGKCFRNAAHLDRNYAEAYNNLGAIYYFQKSYGKAIHQYETAIKLRPDSATFYGNMGAAYFAKKEPENAMVAYIHALQLDPEVLSHSSRVGIAGQVTPQEERAFYDYIVAKAYAKLGLLDLSLQHLRKAMEEQYKDIDKVYKDSEFATLRKDPRFNDLMTNKPPVIPD